jgi:hypothetical protein
MNGRSLIATGHLLTFMLAIGMIAFFWMIYKKTRKVVRKSRKMCRRESDAYRN